MNEFKQFTKKQMVFIVVFAVGTVCALFLLIEIGKMCFTSGSTPERNYDVYQVVNVDEDDIYVAVKVVRAEDGTYVPLSFYDKSDETVVFETDDVIDGAPEVDEYVQIGLNAYGEKPKVNRITLGGE